MGSLVARQAIDPSGEIMVLTTFCPVGSKFPSPSHKKIHLTFCLSIYALFRNYGFMMHADMQNNIVNNFCDILLFMLISKEDKASRNKVSYSVH